METQLMSLRAASVVYADGSTNGNRVWTDLSLAIHAGEWLMVTGGNGSGKSTLAAVLLELCPLSAGELIKAEKLSVGGVLQSPDSQFVGETIAEEFQYSTVPEGSNGYENGMGPRNGLDRNDTTDRQLQALREVGLDVPLDRPLAQLSGGQMQLVNLAIALYAKPDLLILDEPTAMLDPAAQSAVLAAVRTVHQKGTSIVWVTHRLEELAEAERVIVFVNGAVGYDGDPLTFFYGGAAEAARMDSPCGRLGMKPPFVVQTAQHLIGSGWELQPLPLRAEQLAEAVSRLCQ